MGWYNPVMNREVARDVVKVGRRQPMDERRKRALPPEVAAALSELKATLTALYGERLHGVYLYGSYARGDFAPESSDIDVLLVLAGEVSPGDELGCYNDVVSAICLRHGLLISTYAVPIRWLTERRDPFFENVRREAVAV